MKNKVMPLRAMSAIEGGMSSVGSQFGQLHTINSIIDAAKNFRKNMNFGGLKFSKAGFMNEHVIKFENFSMVPFDPASQSDYEDYKSIVSDAEIMKTVSVFNRRVPTESEAQKVYNTLTEVNKLAKIPLSYKVVASDGDVMGFIMPAILERNSEGRASVLDFGCLFKRKYRGNAALIVCSAIAKQSFLLPEIKKLVTSALSDNYNPQAIFLRLGFEFVGQTMKEGNDGHTINVFELTRDRFFSGKLKEIKIRDIRNYIDTIASNSSSRDFLKPFCLRT
jgi:hypothetical protein